MSIEESSWLRVEPETGETLRAAAARVIREAILSGSLRPGVALPSSRALAAQLGVSRGVATDAYSQLIAQGFLVSRPKAAPIVAEVASRRPRSASTSPARAPRYDLTPTTPDVTLFPRRQWVAALTAAVRTAPAKSYDYGEPCGDAELRAVLADRLGRTRGVVADPTLILVTQGAAQAIDLLARVLALRRARRVIVEDPSLPSQAERFRYHGLGITGQRVDSDGLVTTGLHGDAALVTPAHQFPTGAVLSGARRRELLHWARSNRALVIEDDYDAEFRYDREPVRALQGLDPERVAYVGTVSKTLAPALRIGWVVLPAALAEEARYVKHLLDVMSPALEQRTLARFIASGDVDRHVRRARLTYRRRRDAVIDAFRGELPDLPIEGIAAGLHVLVRLPPGTDDVAIAEAAERQGICVQPLSTLHATRSEFAGLVIGYGRLHESAAKPAIRGLAGIVRPCL